MGVYENRGPEIDSQVVGFLHQKDPTGYTEYRKLLYSQKVSSVNISAINGTEAYDMCMATRPRHWILIKTLDTIRGCNARV